MSMNITNLHRIRLAAIFIFSSLALPLFAENGKETLYVSRAQSFQEKLAKSEQSARWRGFEKKSKPTFKIRGERFHIETHKGWAVPNALFLADLDSDNRLDLVVDNELSQNQSFHLNMTKRAYFILNRGNSKFSTPQAFKKQASSEMLSDVADLTGDGINDLITYDFWKNCAFVYPGSRGLKFKSPKVHQTSIHGGESYAVDRNNDGQLDLVSGASGSGRNFTIHFFDSYANNKGEKSSAATPWQWGRFHHHFIPLHWNQDEILDYLVSDLLYGHLYLGDDHGKYSGVDLKHVAFSQDVFPFAFTKNGEAMIGFVGQKDVTFLKYDKENPSKPKEVKMAHRMALGHALRARRLCDLNQDGYPDIIAVIEGNKLAYQLADKEGKYSSDVTVIEGMGEKEIDKYSGLLAADINADGFPDLITLAQSKDGKEAEIAIYYALLK